MTSRQTITPCLWFEDQALEAAEFYTSVFTDSSIVTVQRAPADTPGPKAGSVLVVQFKLAGQDYQARAARTTSSTTPSRCPSVARIRQKSTATGRR